MQLRLADVGGESVKFLNPIDGVFNAPDCPLVEAVRLLGQTPGDFVGDARFALLAVRNEGSALAAGVSVDHAAAVRLYTFEKKSAPSLYALLNEALRSEDRKLCVPYFRFMKLLLTAIKVVFQFLPDSMYHSLQSNQCCFALFFPPFVAFSISFLCPFLFSL